MKYITQHKGRLWLPAVIVAVTMGWSVRTVDAKEVGHGTTGRSSAAQLEGMDGLVLDGKDRRGKQPAVRGGVEWCQTEIKWRAKAGLHGEAARACTSQGTCDTPAVRDSWIPDGGTSIVPLRIKFNVFCNTDGTSCAATQAGVDAQMVQLNSDFGPSKIQFVASTEFINDTTYRQFADSEEFAMKSAYADSPGTQLNVYVVNIQAGYLGVGTFAWDPDATGTQGGLINDDSWFGAGQKTLTHEVGHCVGLWHTHHGVSEVAQCSACWERADGVDGDVTGDFAADSDPTPTNYTCNPPGGTDPCSGVPWGATMPENYMGYAPDSCYTEFTPQQFGREHCWVDDQLTGWRASGLMVTPAAGLDSEGPAGGPFTPGSIIYTLENQNDTGINYSVTNSENWVSLSATGGFLAGHATTDVTVSINSNADALANGNYTDTVNFLNTTDGDGNTTRDVALRVGVPTTQYSWDMGTDPGWTTQGLWAWGKPTGGGGQYGGPDPTSGYTGNTIYGYNLSGDYQNNLPETHLTTGAINCTGFLNTTLRFQRWLGVEVSTYDHAYVRVSNNGSSWTTVWQNTVEVTDTAWSLQEFDIAPVADDQATVYLRWTMGTTDTSWQYCGWNVDDVEILAVAGGGPTCSDGIQNQGEDRIDCGGPCPACQCTSDPACDDGEYCNGAETCDAYGVCQSGTAVNCDDGVGCTDDSCNEGTDSCDNVANDGNCDDGLYCNGAETCHATLDCQSGTAVNCDDGVGCTDDSCNEGTDSCDRVPNNANCDNGLYCDGAETCHATLDCQAGTAVDCNDGVGCTDDSCNEGTDSCDNVTNDGLCDNGLYCDGAETCHATLDCQSGTAVNCDDGVGCTDDSCNETTDSCDNTANDANCDDTLFCNGAETCHATLDCQAGSDPCPGEGCDEGADVCIPVACNDNGTCESGEDCNNCPNDCISGGGGTSCGDGICQPSVGEDCRTCDLDCRGKLNGNPSRQYCCGDDVDCTDSRCNADPWVCDNTPANPYCCGDGTCDGIEDNTNCAVDCPPPYCGDTNCDPGEDQCNCPGDCGVPPTTEANCSDGVDNDCDGFTDGDDSDCDCGVRGDPCAIGADCCSGNCKRNGTCKQ